MLVFSQNRLQDIMRERYIHTPQNQKLWEFLDDLLLLNCPESPRPKVMGVLWTGLPDAGKTTSVRQYIKCYLENEPNAQPKDILYHQIFGRSKLKGELARLCRNTLKIGDVPENPGRNYPTWLLVEKAAGKLRKDGVRMLILDELQKLLRLSENERIDVLEALNDLLNASHVPLVLVGVEGVDEVLDMGAYASYEDKSNLRGTFCSRFKLRRLLPWDEPDHEDYTSFLMTIHNQVCRLRPPEQAQPFFVDPALREVIIELTNGLTAKIIDLLKYSAREIIRERLPEVITIDLLRRVAEQLKSVVGEEEG